ncbi:hypothetical protein X946_5519 [Burkholderia sp. ABCPW 111]|nr:hypothetical protein X946_5519 [Burkholderia sp. ABCPW 111]
MCPKKNSTVADAVRRTCLLPLSYRNDASNHEENHPVCVGYLSGRLRFYRVRRAARAFVRCGNNEER